MLKKVIEIATQAGKMMLKGFHNIEEKTDTSNIVTNMDIEVQDFIIQELKKLLADSSFIAEESESYEEHDGYTWVIDPIDGTMNYAYGYQHSAVSIALLKDNEGIMGVCYNPYLKEVFYAEKGKGAFCNKLPLQVGNQALANGLLVCGTSPYYKCIADTTFLNMKKLFLKSRDIRRSGSAVLDLCYVAAGRCDAFYEEQLSPWDYAAASVILKEAGGYIHLLHDQVWGYAKPIGMIAGNEGIVKEVIETLQ